MQIKKISRVGGVITVHDSNAEQREMGSMCCCSKLYTNYENIRTQIRGPKTLHMSRSVVTQITCSQTHSRGQRVVPLTVESQGRKAKVSVDKKVNTFAAVLFDTIFTEIFRI